MNDWEANCCDECTESGTENTMKECEKADSKLVPLTCCPSTKKDIKGNKVSAIKVPVVLGEVDIQVAAESILKFNEPVYEIKRIRKNVFIDQCEVSVDHYKRHKGKMIISGYVKANIEYATAKCMKDGIVNGDIKHMTDKIPFACFTDVTFDNLPEVPHNYKQEEIIELGEKRCECTKYLTGKNECKNILYNEENFMEKIYCEFEQSRIHEIDLQQSAGKDCCCGFDDKPTMYKGMVGKMGINLRIKMLQNQVVTFLKPKKDNSECGCDD